MRTTIKSWIALKCGKIRPRTAELAALEKSWIGLKCGKIRPRTAELAALEKSPKTYIDKNVLTWAF